MNREAKQNHNELSKSDLVKKFKENLNNYLTKEIDGIR